MSLNILTRNRIVDPLNLLLEIIDIAEGHGQPLICGDDFDNSKDHL